MAFMQPEIAFMTVWHVETTSGTETVPCDVAGVTGLPCNLTLEACTPYLEGAPLNDDPQAFGDGIDEAVGYFARLSAPGYMDCTEWSGPFKSKAEAMAYLVETFDLDADEGGELEA